MFFRRKKNTQREWAIGLDFGANQLRGVLIGRQAVALRYKTVDKPSPTANACTAFGYCLEAFDVRPFVSVVGKADSIAEAAATVAQLFNGWNTPGRCAFVVINPAGAIINQTELPSMPLPEAREALRFNQRNLGNCYFDLAENGASDVKNAKMQLLVGAATREEVLWYRDVMVAAKVRPMAIELSTLTVVNGLLLTEPELCQNETVLLLDIRAKTTAMNFLQKGRLLFTYVMNSGSSQITKHLALKLNLDLETAEQLQKSAPVEEFMQPAIAPLAHELRATIDFFEGQHECRVGRVFACGDLAGAPKNLEILSRESGIHIEAWDFLQRLDITKTRGGDSAQLAAVAPNLGAAVGAALARLSE